MEKTKVKSKKSPSYSQQLRLVLLSRWESGTKEIPFDVYYADIMTRIIDNIRGSNG